MVAPVRWSFARFNPRVREGRDMFVSGTRLPVGLFQSTRPRRTRLHREMARALELLFQSTRPRRTRHPAAAQRRGRCWFQSTRPRRTRPKEVLATVDNRMFQSTRPRRTRRP